MYSRASHPLEYIFFLQYKNVLKGLPPPSIHFFDGERVKKMYSRTSHVCGYIFLFWNVKMYSRGWDALEYIFFAIVKMYSRGWDALEYIFCPCKNVLKGVGRPPVHFLPL